MDKAFAVHPLAQACLAHQPDKAPFENARPDARQDVILRAPFQHHGVDALAVQQLP